MLPGSVQKALRKVDKARAKSSKRAKKEKKNKTREGKAKGASPQVLQGQGQGVPGVHVAPSPNSLLNSDAAHTAASAEPPAAAAAAASSSKVQGKSGGKGKKSRPPPRAAIVYLCCKGHHDVAHLQASLRLLLRNFLARFPYPVFILHDRHIQQQHKEAILNASRPASDFSPASQQEGQGGEASAEVRFVPINISASLRGSKHGKALKCRWHYQGYCEMSRFLAGTLHHLPQVPTPCARNRQLRPPPYTPWHAPCSSRCLFDP